PIAGDHVVDQPDRALLADRERRHRLREDHRLLQRQYRERPGQLDLGLEVGRRVEGEVGHFAPISITTWPCGVGRSVTGSVIVTTPCSYRACERSGSTFSGRRTW